MNRFLLDTNVISDSVKSPVHPRLAEWFARQRLETLFISAFTIAEIKKGILQKEPGKRRRVLESWFEGNGGPSMQFRGRILPFDEEAGLVWAKLMADGIAIGRPRSETDMIIAATALSNQCTLVTANERHFKGVVDFINPQRGET